MLPSIDSLLELAKGAALILPLVIGVTEVLKRTLDITQRYMPLTSTLVGIAVGLVFVQLSVIGGGVGLILGLAACGLWDFGKKTVAGKLSTDA
jgi:hypothetical protein